MNTPMNSYPLRSKMSKIEFRDVSFSYSRSGRNSILNNMNTSFDSNKITVITGPSGCGKSTVLYLAAGIYPEHAGVLQKGEILVDGKEVAVLSPDRRCAFVGMMFQNPDLQFCMDTVENEILFCLGNICTPREEMMEISRWALEFCGIIPLKDRPLQSLSGGEKQKAMLACLIALKPRWLLLDEPFANIDEESSADLVRKIAQLHQRGVGILVVDHRLDYWLPIADEIRLMDSETGIGQVGYKPEELSSEVLMNMGILAPEGHYRCLSEMENIGSTEPVLQLNHLSVIRDNRPVLSEVNFEFRRQKIYAIIGASGSGKSTLLSAIGGLYPYRGNILLKGRNIRKRIGSNVGAIGFVTQNPKDQFIADTVLREIEISLHHSRGRKNVDAEVELILREIGLWGYRNFSPYMLSQGQQRRLGVAALLAYDCDVLICDEPTYAQDRDNTISIMNALIEKVKERHMTLIFSTHDYRLAEDYADVILQLEGGKLRERSKSSL